MVCPDYTERYSKDEGHAEVNPAGSACLGDEPVEPPKVAVEMMHTYASQVVQ